jgi:hypothetical protein
MFIYFFPRRGSLTVCDTVSALTCAPLSLEDSLVVKAFVRRRQPQDRRWHRRGAGSISYGHEHEPAVACTLRAVPFRNMPKRPSQVLLEATPVIPRNGCVQRVWHIWRPGYS